jgi:hypothetical protein
LSTQLVQDITAAFKIFKQLNQLSQLSSKPIHGFEVDFELVELMDCPEPAAAAALDALETELNHPLVV